MAELKTLENRQIKTGIVNCKTPIINIDEEKIDILNINEEIKSKIKFPNIEIGQNGDIEIKKSLNRQLANVNCPFLHYLGQSIISKQLGENYQAIPQEFVIYQENDFRHLFENADENNLTNYLIVICPTNCNGGDINFPQLKKKFSPKMKKNILNYVLFEKKTNYEISKIENGLRVLIVYQIFVNYLDVEFHDFTIIDTEKLKGLLKNIEEKNVLIPITEVNVVKKICDDIKIKYREVYAEEELPKIVYDEISDAAEQSFCRYNVCLSFEDLIYDSNVFSVGSYVNLSTPQIIRDKYTRYRKNCSPKSSSDEVDYYSFLLINPCTDYKPEKIE